MGTLAFVTRGAQLSRDRRFRYALWRTWDEDKGHVMFVGLNPSTADENLDDPTIRRCIGFAKAWGYGGIQMLNLFALRATDPKVLKETYNANLGQASYTSVVGLENDRFLEMYAARSRVVVAAWGVLGAFCNRDERAQELIPKLHCLGVTKDGHPRHPLYVSSDQKLRLWP